MAFIEKKVPEKKPTGIIKKLDTVLCTSQVKDRKPVNAPIDENITAQRIT